MEGLRPSLRQSVIATCCQPVVCSYLRQAHTCEIYNRKRASGADFERNALTQRAFRYEIAPERAAKDLDERAMQVASKLTNAKGRIRRVKATVTRHPEVQGGSILLVADAPPGVFEFDNGKRSSIEVARWQRMWTGHQSAPCSP
jgi:hypothetical protein